MDLWNTMVPVPPASLTSLYLPPLLTSQCQPPFHRRRRSPLTSPFYPSQDWISFCIFYVDYALIVQMLALEDDTECALLCQTAGYRDEWRLFKTTFYAKLFLSLCVCIQLLKVIKFTELLIPKMSLMCPDLGLEPRTGRLTPTLLLTPSSPASGQDLGAVQGADRLALFLHHLLHLDGCLRHDVLCAAWPGDGGLQLHPLVFHHAYARALWRL